MTSGDVDGDGLSDIIVGVDQAEGVGAGLKEAGRAYIFYGPQARDTRLDFAGALPRHTVVYGIDSKDHFGSMLASGDVDGDGYDDVIGGAAAYGTLRNAYDRAGGAGDGPDNGRINAGEMYVLFGEADLPRHIDLRANPPSSLLKVYGADCGTDLPEIVLVKKLSPQTSTAMDSKI